MEYDEIQSNEVEALKAIYGSDFKDLPNSSAWNKKPSPKFAIRLRPSAEFEDSSIEVYLQTTMTPTYPKTLPEVQVIKSKSLSGRQLEILRQLIAQTLKSLKGSEMIFEVTSNIQQQIDEWARFVAEAAPNLEEDRLRRLKLEENKQKIIQDKIQEEREAAEYQSDQKYDSLVLAELQRSESAPSQPPERSLIVVPESTLGVTTFERPVRISQVVFRQVMTGLTIPQAFFGETSLCRALLPASSSGTSVDLPVLLSKITLSAPYWRTPQGARELHELNQELELVRQLNLPGALPLSEFAIESSKNEWTITLVNPGTSLASMDDMLSSVDTIPFKSVQAWSFQILETLEELHKSGLRHSFACPWMVLLSVDQETGERNVLLRHPQYFYTLLKMNELHPFEEQKTYDWLEHVKQWIPPEGRSPDGILGAAPSEKSSSSSGSSSGAQTGQSTKKWDVWQLGALITYMIAGKRALHDFRGDPESYVRSMSRAWPPELTSFLLNILHPDPAKRPTVFELMTNQFFRMDLDLDSHKVISHKGTSHKGTSHKGISTVPMDTPKADIKHVHHSPTEEVAWSRYRQDFDEGVLLGRGGFGQVVKARNKLDGRIYAVKKVKATSKTLSHILQEVVLLSRLNHRYVVRYFTVWLEDESDIDTLASQSLTDSELTSKVSSAIVNQPLSQLPSITSSQFAPSLSELDIPSVSQDYMSDSGFVEFGFSDSGEVSEVTDGDVADEEGVVVGEAPSHPRRSVSARITSNPREFSTRENSPVPSPRRRPFLSKLLDTADSDDDGDTDAETDREAGQGESEKPRRVSEDLAKHLAKVTSKTLYIQMEYCENHTLGDVIKQGLYKDHHEYWRLFREILEALAYIHSEGVIHRDLKPKNIFIDQARNIKIGDFGLARSVGKQLIEDGNNSGATPVDEELTTDVGTSLYAAVEVMQSDKRGYNEKVDIFSLGIIFFEMVCGFETDMERIQSIKAARKSSIELPSRLVNAKDTRAQVGLIRSMLDHNPARRPSAVEMLQSGEIPVEDREMTIREALNNVRDPAVVQQLTSELFSRPRLSAQEVLYDRLSASSNQRASARLNTSGELVAMSYVQEAVRQVFRTHAAIDNTGLRARIFPRSNIYKTPTVFEVMDRQGTVLQLPHDLTVPNARRLAEVVPQDYRKAFAIDSVYRQRVAQPHAKQHPLRHTEVDFDIVSLDTQDTAFDDAEAMAVMHDAAATVLQNNNALMVVVSHQDIISATLSQCGLVPPQYATAISLLVNSSLRGPALARSGISTASLDMLGNFGFREDMLHAERRLSKLMPLSDRVKRGLGHLRNVVELFSRLCTQSLPRVMFSPLINTGSAEFYIGGIVFQLVDFGQQQDQQVEMAMRRFGTGQALALGGRYDSLIKSFRNSVLDGRTPLARAVGFGMSADKLAALVQSTPLKPVASQPHSEPRCQVLVSSLSEESIRKHGVEVIKLLWSCGVSADLVRHSISTDAMLALAQREQVPIAVIIKQGHDLHNRNLKPLRVKRSSGDTTDLALNELIPFIKTEIGISSSEHPNNVDVDLEAPPAVEVTGERVIVINESGKLKGGRKNKWQLEERGSERRAQLLAELAQAPIISLDLRDDVLQAITTVSPHAVEDWKRRVVGLSPNQKAYIMTVQTKVANEALKSPQLLLYSSKTENIFVYNY